MKTQVRRAARWLRHQPCLENADWLWDRARLAYERALRAGNGGIVVRVAGIRDVLMPPEYASGAWDDYEPDSVRALCAWVDDHPYGTVFDIGCSMGIMSACALAASPHARVVAFDSDLSSLKATTRMTSLIGPDRVSLVYGFVTDEHVSGLTLNEAHASARERLAAADVTGDPGTTQFVCIEHAVDSVPSNSLDGLLREDVDASAPVLVKMDIEGAELLALKGARSWLRAARPALLVSVHPPALAARGETPALVRRYLNDLEYRVSTIAVDHEEHWWCTP